jgi:uncharacterized OsmC-like protein
MSDIRSALEAARRYLTEHPEEAAYTDDAATAVIESGLRARVTGSAGAEAFTDMPPSVGGAGSAPSAGWLLRAAEAACVATLVAMRAAQLGVTIGPLEVVVDSDSDDRGILGLDKTVPAGPLRGRVAVRIDAEGISRGDVEALVRWAVDHCPVTDAVRRAVPMDIEVEVIEPV